MLWPISPFVSGIKDTTWEVAVKNGSEIQMTMAKTLMGRIITAESAHCLETPLRAQLPRLRVRKIGGK